MNFVDPKEYDIPGLVRKNRYKTILPSKYCFLSHWGRVVYSTCWRALHFPECMKCAVTTMYCPKAIFMKQQYDINQISEEVQSMKKLRFTEHQQHLGF